MFVWLTAAALLSKEIPLTGPFGCGTEGSGWLTATLREEAGVRDLDEGLLPSPNLTSDSIVFSRSPPWAFSTFKFRLSSGNPMSLS